MDTNSSNINTTAELHNPLLLEAKTMESECYSSDNKKTVRAKKKSGVKRSSSRGSYSKGPHSDTICAAEKELIGGLWQVITACPFKPPMDGSVGPKICQGNGAGY